MFQPTSHLPPPPSPSLTTRAHMPALTFLRSSNKAQSESRQEAANSKYCSYVLVHLISNSIFMTIFYGSNGEFQSVILLVLRLSPDLGLDAADWELARHHHLQDLLRQSLLCRLQDWARCADAVVTRLVHLRVRRWAEWGYH